MVKDVLYEIKDIVKKTMNFENDKLEDYMKNLTK